jgi:hypothetical protein
MTIPVKDQRVIINEGTLKKNLNDPPTSARPAAPKAQVAPPPPKKEKSE